MADSKGQRTKRENGGAKRLKGVIYKVRENIFCIFVGSFADVKKDEKRSYIKVPFEVYRQIINDNIFRFSIAIPNTFTPTITCIIIFQRFRKSNKTIFQ